MCVHEHVAGENDTHLRTKRSSTWHVSISPSVGTTEDAPLSDVGSKRYVTSKFYLVLGFVLLWLMLLWFDFEDDAPGCINLELRGYTVKERDVATWQSVRSCWDGRRIVVDLLSYLSFQLMLHNWYNKGRVMYYPVCGMVHIKDPLLLNERVAHVVSALDTTTKKANKYILSMRRRLYVSA